MAKRTLTRRAIPEIVIPAQKDRLGNPVGKNVWPGHLQLHFSPDPPVIIDSSPGEHVRIFTLVRLAFTACLLLSPVKSYGQKSAKLFGRFRVLLQYSAYFLFLLLRLLCESPQRSPGWRFTAGKTRRAIQSHTNHKGAMEINKTQWYAKSFCRLLSITFYWW